MAIDIFRGPAEMLAGEAMPEAVLQPMEHGEDIAAPAINEGARDHRTLIEYIDHPNIADELEDDELSKMGQAVTREREIDLETRSDWEERSKVAMDLAMQITQHKTHPWPNASNIIYPLMTVAAMQFGARAYPSIVQGRNIVKGVVIGPDNGIPQIAPDGSPAVQMTPQGQPQPMWAQPPGVKRQRATRIGEHMSWQLLDEMKEWAPETDKLLHILPVVGCAFRKSFFDPAFQCNSSVLVQAQNLVINYWAKSLERAMRVSEDLKFYPREIEELIRGGLWLEHEFGTAEGSNGDDDAPHDFIEQHRFWDLDGDGYSEPYIVTVHKTTAKVVRVVARYDADGVHINRGTGQVVKIDPVHFYTQYNFFPSLDGGVYGVGFGQVLTPINKAVNTTLNMLVDAGNLQNTGGGFIGRGLSMHSGGVKFKLGEWKVVNAPGQTVRDAIVPMNWPGPSAVLFSLLGTMIEAGKEIASIKDVLAGETNAATMQPTTLLALIEQGLKVFTAIYKRVHDSAKSEFDKLYRLNRKYLEHQQRYQVGDEWKIVTKEDYAKGAGVTPVSDPSMVSDMQKMARAQFLQSYQNDPACDGLEIRRQVFDAAGIDHENIIQKEIPPNPQIIAQTAEMELKGHEIKAKIETERAKQTNLWADTVKKLAEADKINGELPLEWTAQYIDLLRMQMDALVKPKGADVDGGQAQPSGPPMPHPDEMMPAMPVPSPRRALPPMMPQAGEPAPDMSFDNALFARPGAQ